MNSIKNRNEAQISISGSIYRYIKDGKTQVVIHDAEIIKGGDNNILKLCCYDQDGNYGEYSVFANNNPSSIFAKLIRAITSREITQLRADILVGKQLYVTVSSKNGYSNITEIKKVARCDYFETKNLEDIEEDDIEDTEEDDVDEYEEREYTSKERNLNKKTYRSKSHQRRRVQEDEDLEDTEEDDIEDIEEYDAEDKRVYTSKQRSPKKKSHQKRRVQEDEDLDDPYYD